MKKTGFWIGLPLILIGTDQISKWLASKFDLVTLNHGIAFSWLNQTADSRFLSLGTGIFLGLLIWAYLFKLPDVSRLFKFGLALLIAGGVSNTLDRIIWNGVRDWMAIDLLGQMSLKLNLADLVIDLGLILCVFSLIRLIQSPHRYG